VVSAVVQATDEVSVSLYFTITLDSVDLGAWATCSGLGIEIETEGREEGALGLFMHQLTGRFRYTNLTLSRPVSKLTNATMAWLSQFALAPMPTTAQVEALDPSASHSVMTWSLYGVVPVRWTGPSFDAQSPQVATETLELAHQGFL
jgi:phage tail-like protein